MKSSRFVRPDTPSQSIIVQPRDVRLLAALKNYGLLATRHIQALCFPGTALRQVQRRLRLLWTNELINRRFKPVIIDGRRPFSIEMAYCLGPRSEGLDVEDDVLGPPKEPALSRFDHEMAIADCLTALIAACRDRPDVTAVVATPTLPLMRRLHAGSRFGAPGRDHLVPDGAVTLTYPSGDVLTYYIEIVRADVKGGNDTLKQKMADYARLNRESRFRDLYGHEQLRAVLFLTTSDERAEHFRRLAGTLQHGRRLFWFGTYQTTDTEGRILPGVTAGNVFDARWRTVDGAAVSFLTPDA